MKQKIYKEILRRTYVALNRLDIPVFLSSGTLLGYHRDKKFIDHDYDIDVGIFKEDYKPELILEMENQGLILYRVWGNKDTGMELSFIMPNTPLFRFAKIDIFLHYRDIKQGTVSWFTYSPQKKRIQFRVSNFALKEAEFVGLNVLIPDPVERYIEEHYGEDWKTPKKPITDYRYWESPKSVVK